MAVTMFWSSGASGGRNISLPFEEKFDSSNYQDLLWISSGATHSWDSTGGWRGGAARFTPPVGNAEGYSGLGQFTGLSGTQINVRFLIYHGSAYIENERLQNKVIIINRGVEQRPMIISRVYDDQTYMTYGACDGTTCRYEGGDFWPDGTDRLRIGNPPGREMEWVCIEFEANSATGVNNLYVHTQDGVLSGLYVSKPMGTAGEEWSAVDIIGGFFHAGGVANANNYFKIDELAISNRYIGPPQGFLAASRRPAQPKNIYIVEP